MKPSKILHITGFISLLLLSAASVMAENCLDAREWYDEGLSLADNSEQEVSYYQQAIHLCHEYVAAHNRLGEVYKNQKKYGLSIQAFKQARIQALSSDRFATHSDSLALFLESAISLGEIYKIQGKYERAEREFTKALEVDPDSRTAKNNLQYVFKRLHRYDNVLPSSNNLLVNGIFTRLPGLTLPVDSYSYDFQWKHLKMRSPPVTADMLDMDEIVILPEHQNTTIDGITESDFMNLLTPDELSTTTNIFLLSMRYGLFNNFTVGLIPRIVSHGLKIDLPAYPNLHVPVKTMLGDTQLLFKYHLWGKRKQHFSIYSLLNIPTGSEVKVTGKEPLITRSVYDFEFVRYVPFGSESFDFVPGAALTLGFDPFVIHSNIQYKFTDGILIGDEFSFNLATLYSMNRSVNATMEMNFRWRGDARRKFHTILFKFQPDYIGRDNGTSAGPVAVETYYTAKGGSTLFLSPGLQFHVAEGIRVDAGMQIPVIKSSQGWAESVTYLLGITFMTF